MIKDLQIMKNLLAILAFIVLVLSGCKEKQPDYLVEALNMVEINNPVNILIEDFITDIDTLRLETSDESLMTDISAMHVMDGRYYILTNKYSSVHIFDSTGKFISKINDMGDGPGEYIRISSFEVDRINQRVILADVFSRRIFIYNTNGAQIETIQLDFQPRLIIPHKNGFLNIYSGPRDMYEKPEMENNNVHFLDSAGKFISSALEITTPGRIDMSSAYMADCLHTGEVLFQPVLSDIIYRIEENNILPLYGFTNSSRFKLLSQKEKKDFQMVFEQKNSFKEKEEQGYLLTWGAVRDLDDYVFFSFGGWDKKYYLYYSKNLRQSILIDPLNTRGNKSLSEVLLLHPKAVNGNKFYISPDLGMIEYLTDKLPDGSIKTFFKKTDFDSNPVLISFSIKFPDKK